LGVRGNNTDRRIAEAALHLLEKEGQAAVTMRRIAKAVRITPMAIYHHFPNRAALLKIVTDREFEKLAAFMGAREARGTRNGEDRLLGVMDYYIDYAFKHPKVFDYVFSQFRTDARRFPKDFRARRSPTMNRVADAVAAAMRRQEIRRDDVWEVAMELWAHVHGYVALFRAGRFALSEKQLRSLCRRSLKRLFKGLKT
jgi:AcrR family transcriptional regulator